MSVIPKEILEQYKKSIPAKLEEIEGLILEAKASSEALRFAVHKLAGSSGTYGYHEASDLCKTLETNLNLDAFLVELKKRLSCG